LTASEAKGKEDARVIYLNDAAKKLVEELMKTNPTGRLLRNSKGNPWTRNAIVCGFRRIRARTGLKGFVAYVLRHTFATDALTRGEDSVTVAALMGHRDPTMVAQVYSHVTKKPKFLSDAVKRARGESTKSVSAEE
jgi:site-specific recombinase XerD